MHGIMYADLHCDSLTACKKAGASLLNFGGQVSLKKLKRAGCTSQCFAIFTDGPNARTEFFETVNYFYSAVKQFAPYICPIQRGCDLKVATNEGKISAILTAENIGFAVDEHDVALLKEKGICIASLVWNNPNPLAQPNVVRSNGRLMRSSAGLSDRGKLIAHALVNNNIIIDISHLSDGGVDYLLHEVKRPIVATHSCCAALCNHPRNLTDEQIKRIANCGGVVGINLYSPFLGGSTFWLVLEHIKHLVDVGGEGVVAFGCDFDGMPPTSPFKSCLCMPHLLDFLNSQGLASSLLERLAYKNFDRVFNEVLK